VFEGTAGLSSGLQNKFAIQNEIHDDIPWNRSDGSLRHIQRRNNNEETYGTPLVHPQYYNHTKEESTEFWMGKHNEMLESRNSGFVEHFDAHPQRRKHLNGVTVADHFKGPGIVPRGDYAAATAVPLQRVRFDSRPNMRYISNMSSNATPSPAQQFKNFKLDEVEFQEG